MKQSDIIKDTLKLWFIPSFYKPFQFFIFVIIVSLLGAVFPVPLSSLVIFRVIAVFGVALILYTNLGIIEAHGAEQRRKKDEEQLTEFDYRVKWKAYIESLDEKTTDEIFEKADYCKVKAMKFTLIKIPPNNYKDYLDND